MSFGKRGLDTSNNRPVGNGKASPLPATGDGEWHIPRGYIQLAQAAAMLAVIITVIKVVPDMMFASAKKKLDAHWRNINSQVAFVMASQADDLSLRLVDQRLNEQCLPRLRRYASMPRDEGVKPLQRIDGTKDDMLVNSQGRIVDGMLVAHLDEAADYIACSMEVEQQRFCDAHHRGLLVERLRQYLDVHAKYQVKLQEQAVMDSFMAGRAAESRIETGTVTTAPVTEDIAAGIAVLSSKGYLSASDFGWFGTGVPPDLAPHLRGESEEASCK